MIDRSTKIILAVIAAGLWANFGLSLLTPSKALAESDLLGGLVRNYAASAGSDFSLIKKAILSIADGTCANKKLCGPV